MVAEDVVTEGAAARGIRFILPNTDADCTTNSAIAGRLAGAPRADLASFLQFRTAGGTFSSAWANGVSR
jgi:hypothetical protein